MELFHLFAGILSLSAIFAYFNQRTLRLPATIALMIVGLLLSLLLIGLGAIFPGVPIWAEAQLETINFSELVLSFLLSFLLFAGALHTDLNRLASLKWPILSFATIGVVISTLLIAWATCGLMTALGKPIDFIYCLLFGALISPTDPIAVLGILKKAGVPKDIEIKITGESLFNDGVGVVVFLSLFHIAKAGGVVDTTFIVELLLGEIVGGVALGLALGFVGFQLLKRIDHYPTEVLISLAIVMGGYSAALLMHFSGPLAMVVAGLWLGNKGHKYAMSDITSDYLTKFWEMLDEILNALLFVLIGLELLVVNFDGPYLAIGLICALVVIGARYVALALPSYLLGFKKTFPPNTLKLLTWGGLRGGISIALALSLTPDMPREPIVAITYVVVLVSLLVQGLTIGNVAKSLVGGGKKEV